MLFSLAIFGLPGFLFFGFGTHELLPPHCRLW